MGNLELDYETLRKDRPELINVRMTGFGLTGPWRDFVSYGPTLQALAGLPFLMRHPGEPPAGWGYSYSDMAAGAMGAIGTLLALWHRERTGEGQLVDLSQLETLVSLLGPEVLAYARGGAASPMGNRCQEKRAVPHGLYPCAPTPTPGGEQKTDRWIAISVLEDRHWGNLAELLVRDGQGWAADPRFAELEGRELAEEDLDCRISTWTSTLEVHVLEARLQAAGIPAAVVADAEDLERDPQLLSRGFFERVLSPEGEAMVFDGIPWQTDGISGRIRGPGPRLGEHTDQVLGEVLGLGDGEIRALRDAGVVA
jgi:benzylsuccinate CoA-transferase BbsF subunit